ncbi:sorting nexin-10A [Diretmus argenteus]
MKTEFVSICVRDPRLHRDDFWHTHVDYEICLHTNSMCFRKKTSYVRRRYSEFVWLRHCLLQNALIMDLPKLPPWKAFFSLSNPEQVNQRMKGLQEFLEIVLQTPLLVSDCRLHLFLQSELSMAKMEKCVLGQTRYTVAEAIQRAGSSYLEVTDKVSCDSDCESSSSSGVGVNQDTLMRSSPLPMFETSDGDPDLCSSLSDSPSDE